MFMAVIGGVTLHALLTEPTPAYVLLWSATQKAGAFVAVTVGVTRDLFAGYAMAVALFDLATAVLAADGDAHRALLADILQEVFATRPASEWVDLLLAAGIPAGPINTIDKVFADPQVQHLGVATPMESPKHGKFNVVASPINMEGLGKQIRIIVGLSSGGGYDRAARLIRSRSEAGTGATAVVGLRLSSGSGADGVRNGDGARALLCRCQQG